MPEIIRAFDSTILNLNIKKVSSNIPDTNKGMRTNESKKWGEKWCEKWGKKWGERWEKLWPEIESWWKEEIGLSLSNSEIKILDLMAVIPDISMITLAETIGIVETAIGKNIRKLKEKEIIVRVGPAKGGYWKIIR